ncbi:MAG: phosphatase PAP2 family protein [Acidimicrobiales bacterium]|nr:phosphatase PAP2 family protein [Acidimicrobiales bacterium]
MDSTATTTLRPDSAVTDVHVHAEPPVTPGSVLRPRFRLVVVLVTVFVALAAAAALWQGQVLLTWDEPIQRTVESQRGGSLDRFFLTISRFGSTIPVLTLGTLAAVVTWRRCQAVGTAVLVATFSRPLLEFSLKVLVDRDRPDFERLVAGNGPSFPSGHVMASVALWGLLPLVVSLYTRRRSIWWVSVALAAGLIAAISASRIYLGVHWFSDVVGGLIVGAFFLLGIEALLENRHLRSPCALLGSCHEPGDGLPVSPDDEATGVVTASTAVTGRWSDSRANPAKPSSSGSGVRTSTTSIDAET